MQQTLQPVVVASLLMGLLVLVRAVDEEEDRLLQLQFRPQQQLRITRLQALTC